MAASDRVTFGWLNRLTGMVDRDLYRLLTRRQAAGILGGLAAIKLSGAARPRVGLQLFSLRTQCEADLEGTLAYVREIGFEGVELAGFYGRSAAQFKSLLDKNSLECCGSHTPLPQLTGERLQATIADSHALQNRNLIIPGLPEEYQKSAASWKEAAKVLNEIAEKLRPEGLRVGYHNHAVEFHPLEGVIPWVLLFENTRPEVILQLDTGNARIGGADPTELVRQHPGREVTVHVKDYTPQVMDPVLGTSNFNWKPFVETCRTNGATEWFIIEHDSPRREDVKVCFDRFRQWL